MTFVSFVLPCFNSAQYLQQTLDSISAQSHTHWECIAIDDGSTDNTLALLQAAADIDSRFKVISRENRGLIASLNEAIAASSGEWIARIDADDICEPDRIAQQLAHCAATNADVCGTWVRFIGDRDGEWHTPVSDAAIRVALLFNTPLAHPSVLARACVLKARPYPADAPHAEDYALWCQLAAGTPAIKFANVPQVLLRYRTHSAQVTQAKKAALRLTAQRVREEYAKVALPVPLQPLASEFAKLAEPGRILTREEWQWMGDFFTQLIGLQPESRQALGCIWLDTLQRTFGVNVADLPRALRLALQMPVPKAERKKMLKQTLRMVVSDRLWRQIKNEQKIKIAIFLRDLGLGGVERCAVLVGEGLSKLGFDVTLVLLGGSRNLWAARINQVKIIDLSSQWQPLKPWTWWSGWRAARKIAREHDVIIAGTFLLPLYMSYAASLGLGKRVIAWVHGPFYELDQFARMNPVHRHACQFAYRRLDELIFVSQHARDSMARWLDCKAKPCWRVLPNFVDDLQQTPARIVRAPDQALRLVFVGRIAIEKQPALWLATLAALNARNMSATLTIVGDGPLEEQLREQAQQQGLTSQIEFAGRSDNVSDYLANADVLLLTSNFEGCPLVVLEAMPMGLLVASTNAGGVYELFGERHADFVVDTASGEVLADLIIAQQAQALELENYSQQRSLVYSQQHILQQWAALLQHKLPSEK